MKEGGAFWRFSLGFYRTEAAQAVCLALQDEHGGDVNLALYLLWRASRGERLSEKEVARIDAHVAAWRERVVRPLRALRRELKTQALLSEPDAQEAFRRQVKDVELAAEKAQQAELESLAPPAQAAPPAEAARANLAAYAARLRAHPQASAFEGLLRRFDEIAGR